MAFKLKQESDLAQARLMTAAYQREYATQKILKHAQLGAKVGWQNADYLCTVAPGP